MTTTVQGPDGQKLIDGNRGVDEADFALNNGIAPVHWTLDFDAPRTVNEVVLYMAPTTFGHPPIDETEDSTNPMLALNFTVALRTADGTYINGSLAQGNTKRVRRMPMSEPAMNVSSVTFYLRHNNGAPNNAVLMAEIEVL